MRDRFQFVQQWTTGFSVQTPTGCVVSFDMGVTADVQAVSHGVFFSNDDRDWVFHARTSQPSEPEEVWNAWHAASEEVDMDSQGVWAHQFGDATFTQSTTSDRDFFFAHHHA